MVPSLRKRVWYQRFLRTDEFDTAPYPVLFQRRGCLNLGSSGKVAGSRRSWRRQSRHCDSHDSESSSSTSSSVDDLRSKEIKMEASDLEDLQGNVFPLKDVTSKGHGRMLMREWLEVNANGGSMSGLKWLDKDLGLVQIAWKHGSRAGWNRSDVEVFESWALHTGKFNSNKFDCKRWKANFRCALNSLPDVVEMKERANTNSRNPYKVYRLLPHHGTAKQLKSKKLKSSNGLVEADFVSSVSPTDQSDITIKIEPHHDESYLASGQMDYWQQDNLVPKDTSNFWNLELSVHQDRVCDHPSFNAPIISIDNIDKNPKQFEATENCARYTDHSYASINERLAEYEEICAEPEFVDCQDLVSTINAELEKFSSSSIYLDLWNEEINVTTKDFVLQDI